MRTSSARQLEIPGLSATEAFSGAGGETASVTADSPTEATVTAFTPLSAPSAALYGSAYAITSRLLARLNTTTVKKEEYEDLLKERQKLLDKKFSGSMTPLEENRLEYVRWSLDRIQDVTSGPSLDALEAIVSGYEKFLNDMRHFEGQLHGAAGTSKKRGR